MASILSRPLLQALLAAAIHPQVRRPAGLLDARREDDLAAAHAVLAERGVHRAAGSSPIATPCMDVPRTTRLMPSVLMTLPERSIMYAPCHVAKGGEVQREGW